MLFLENAYLKDFETNIVNIENNKIILNQTTFYAKSGGQPGDIGTLSNEENNKLPKYTSIFNKESK